MTTKPSQFNLPAMTIRIDIAQAADCLEQLVEAAIAGDEVILSCDGKDKVQIVPITPQQEAG